MNAAFEHISLYALGDWIGEALGDHVRRFQNCNEQFTTEIHDSFWHSVNGPWKLGLLPDE